MSKVTATIPETEELDSDLDFPVDEVDDNASSTAVMTMQSGAVGQLTGAIAPQDIPMPILSIAYGVGALSELFNPGDLVLDKEHLLVHKAQPLNVIIVSADVYWKEYLDQAAFQAGLRPSVCRTTAEVEALGGTTTYGEDGSPPTFKQAMTVKMLIEKPEDVDCYMFSTELLGRKYAPARWYVDKTAFKRRGGKGVGVEIVKQAGFALKERGLLAGKWQVTTGFEEMGKNKVIAPSIKLVGQHTDEEIAEIRKAIGA